MRKVLWFALFLLCICQTLETGYAESKADKEDISLVNVIERVIQRQYEKNNFEVITLEFSDTSIDLGVFVNEDNGTLLAPCVMISKYDEIKGEWIDDVVYERIMGLYNVMESLDAAIYEAGFCDLINEEKMEYLIGQAGKLSMGVYENRYKSGYELEKAFAWEIMPFFFTESADSIYENSVYLYIRLIKENTEKGKIIEEWLIANQDDVYEVLEVLKNQDDGADQIEQSSLGYLNGEIKTENTLGMTVFEDFQQQIDSENTHVLNLEDLGIKFGITSSEITDAVLSSCFVMHQNSELCKEWDFDAAIERLEGLLEIMIAFDEPMEGALQYSLIDEVKTKEVFGDVNKARLSGIESMYTTGIENEVRWEILPVFFSSSISAIYENTMYIYAGFTPVDEEEQEMIEWIITDEKMVNRLIDIMAEQDSEITDEDRMLVKVWKSRQTY